MLNIMSGLNWLLFITVSFVSRKPMITVIKRQKSISLNDVQCNTTSRPIFFSYLKLQSDKNLKPLAGYSTEHNPGLVLLPRYQTFNKNKI